MYRRPDGLYEKIITIDGKRVPFRAKTEKEVSKKIAEYKGRQETGRSFREIANDWYDDHFATIAYNTQKSYKPAYMRAVENFGDTPVKQIKPGDINSFLGKFARKGYAQKTVKNQLLVLNLIFNHAVIDGDLEINPADHITVPKNLPKGTRELPPDDTLELVKKSIDAPFGFLAYFLLYTGCRIGEALALQYGDIDREKKIIKISKSVYHQNNKPHIKTPKTAAGIREIILLDLLAQHLPYGKSDEYLFPGEDGGPMTYSQTKHAWNAYCKSIGLFDDKIIVDKDGHKHAKIAPHLTPHQLRHGFATILFEAGIDEKDAQELLGHSSISVTRDTYTHIRRMRKEQTAEKLNSYTESTQ